jgi:HSP20 family protein
MLIGWREFDDTLRTLDVLQRHVDRAFDGGGPALRVAADRVLRPAGAAWPAMNVFETKEAFMVKAEIPGVPENAVEVSVEDDQVIVSGERKCDVPQGYKAHVRVRRPTTFTRRVSLSSGIDADGVTATLKDGVLTVLIPKAKEALPRKIEVKAR